MQMRRGAIGPIAATLAGIVAVVAGHGVARSQQQDPAEDQLPRFSPAGQLVKPVGWEAWVMVGSSTDHVRAFVLRGVPQVRAGAGRLL